MTDAPATGLAPIPLTPQQIALIQAVAPLVPPEPEKPQQPERVIVKPAKDSRLEQLLCLYKPYKEAEQQARDAFDNLKKAITTEVEALYPDPATRPSDAFEIPATIMYPAVNVNYKESEYIDGGTIRQLMPSVYNAFKKKKTYSEVRESAKGQGKGRRGRR